MRSHRLTRYLSLAALAALLTLGTACGSEGDGTGTSSSEPDSSVGPGGTGLEGETTLPPDLPPGTDTFLSADGEIGEEGEGDDDARSGGDAEEDMAGPPEAGADEATVEEGDIYRVLEGSLVLNLNNWRGLQVIDFSDPDAPEIIGRAQLSGWPVEMYVIGTEAFVLMNDWRGWMGGSVHAESRGERSGGVVFRVDLADPTAPQIVDTAFVPGSILRSRVVRTQSGDRAALYVAASEYRMRLDEDFDCPSGNNGGRGDSPDMDEWGNDDCRWRQPWTGDTVAIVRSFDLSEGGLVERSTLELGGWVTDIQATPRMLMVARGNQNWWRSGEGSEVQLIDISSPDGEMAARGNVRTRGQVFSQFNMDIHGDILRVVSGSRWGSSQGNFIETWSIADPDAPEPVDVESFGFDNDDLFATLFLGNRAFFVTYERVDPFHAFEITDEGIATEINEFIVSGWNDFFRAVHGERRLIGIGMNDEHGGARAAVSLYDITDLANPEPLVARAEVEAQWTWSEANWDHRAFSVLEGAADAVADDGTPETGLILLPFSGYDQDWGRHVSAVQVFTFSENTLTRRGTMEHGSRVRRSFLADADDSLAGNLSDSSFSLFDLADPDSPQARGVLDLAPNYTHYLALGGFAARVRGQSWYGWYWDEGGSSNVPRIELFEADAHPDVAPAIGIMEVADRSDFLALDGRIVAMGTRWNNGDTTLELDVIEVDDPARPRIIGSLEAPSLAGQDYSWGYDCWNCWGYRPQPSRVQLLGDHLVLAWSAWRYHGHEQPPADMPRMEYCSRYIDAPWQQCSAQDSVLTCVNHHGSRRCVRELPNGEQECSDYGEYCEEVHNIATGEHTMRCQDPDWSMLSPRENCWPGNHRTGSTRELSLQHIDLSDPSAPRAGETLSIEVADHMGSLLTDGDTLWQSWAERVSEDGRRMLRWHIQPWRVVDGELQAGRAINIPGNAMAVQNGYLLSEDRVWHDGRIRAALRLTRLEEDRAVLVDTYLFGDRIIESVTLNAEEGLVLVGHTSSTARWAWPRSPFLGQPGQPTRNGVLSEVRDARLTVFAFDREGIHRRASVRADVYAQLQLMVGRLALFSVNSGVLVMNLEDPSAPVATAWHPLHGWPSAMTEHRGQVIFPSWRYGLYRIDPSEVNLLD